MSECKSHSWIVGKLSSLGMPKVSFARIFYVLLLSSYRRSITCEMYLQECEDKKVKLLSQYSLCRTYNLSKEKNCKYPIE